MSSAPYVAGSSTSEQAARRVGRVSATQREKVLEVLRELGPMTDEEIQNFLDMNPNTQRPRRVELVADGRVRDSGLRRLTKSAREAVVWEIASGDSR